MSNIKYPMNIKCLNSKKNCHWDFDIDPRPSQMSGIDLSFGIGTLSLIIRRF